MALIPGKSLLVGRINQSMPQEGGHVGQGDSGVDRVVMKTWPGDLTASLSQHGQATPDGYTMHVHRLVLRLHYL